MMILEVNVFCGGQTDFEKEMYLQGEINFLKALEGAYYDWSEVDGILQNSTGHYNKDRHISYVFGDYYFVETRYKLKGFTLVFW